MSLHARIRSAMREHLRTLADEGAVPPPDRWALEQRQYTPVVGRSWLRESLKPFSALPASIGPNRLVRSEALYLIDLFLPADDSGSNAADAMADAVLEAFEPGTQLTYDGQVIVVRRAQRMGMAPGGLGWVMLPITIQVRADTITVNS